MRNFSEQDVEKYLQHLGKTAPRLTPDLIDEAIKIKEFWHPTNTTLTICVLTLTNGFNVVGESAAASPENFNVEVGCSLAFQDARNKIWKLEGYLLKEKLYRAAVDYAMNAKLEGG